MEGRMTGSEFYIFTANTTYEIAYFNGTSSSSEMFDCVLWLGLLEMSHWCNIHILHVSGDKQGADGL